MAALNVGSQVTPLKKQLPSLPQALELSLCWPHGDAVRKPVTCVLFSVSHADTLELVGLHVGDVELKSQKSGQLTEVAPAPSATSHAATFIHAVQKSTSSGGSGGE